MDYETKPISREKLRKLAKEIKKIFDCNENEYYFNVIMALEKMHFLFKNKAHIFYKIIEDDPYTKDIPAFTDICDGEYIINIKESVYNAAVKNDGASRMHIAHEISHVILFLYGQKPITYKKFKNKELRPCVSVEWQAKALAGELFIPYEKVKDKTIKEITQLCKVSKDAASFVLSLNQKSSGRDHHFEPLYNDSRLNPLYNKISFNESIFIKNYENYENYIMEDKYGKKYKI